jgi:protein phosphatase
MKLINKLLGSPGWEDSRKSAYGATDVGRERSANEDYFRIIPEKCLYIVADGMGGHAAGDVASLNAAQTVDTYFSRQLLLEIQDDDNKIRKSIVESLLKAHKEILRMAESKRHYEGMGCTIVTAYIQENSLHLGHVGDARAYVCNHSGIKLLTTDHSFVMDLVTKGKMTLEEARISPMKNRLNQAIGAATAITPDYGHYILEEGDRVLLCSDGLWDMLSDEQMHQAIMQDQPAKIICENLINMANKAGGHDNITAVVIIYKKGSAEDEDEFPDDEDLTDTSGEYSVVFKE